MFTGIVEAVGTVVAAAERGRLRVVDIASDPVASDLAVGDSVAVDGACLTAVRIEGPCFTVELTPETLRRTRFGALAPGEAVNLERAVRATGRLGGHVVQGHVDATGEVVDVAPEGASVVVRFRAPPSVVRYVVPKGFVAVDGVSLTVVDASGDTFSVAYIPHTLAHTTAGAYRPGRRVHFEPDILGKYVEHLLAARLDAAASAVPPESAAAPATPPTVE